MEEQNQIVQPLENEPVTPESPSQNNEDKKENSPVQEIEKPKNETKPEEPKKEEPSQSVSFSRKKIFWIAVFAAALNPIFAGFIIAAAFLGEPELKREGKIIALIAIISAVFQYYMVLQDNPALLQN